MSKIVFETDLLIARATARAQRKHIIMDLTRPENVCDNCRKTHKIWNSPGVQPTILKYFVPFEYNIPMPPAIQDTDLWIPYCKGLGDTGIPIILIIGYSQPNGEWFGRTNGIVIPQPLLHWIERIVAEHPLPV